MKDHRAAFQAGIKGRRAHGELPLKPEYPGAEAKRTFKIGNLENGGGAGTLHGGER